MPSFLRPFYCNGTEGPCTQEQIRTTDSTQLLSFIFYAICFLFGLRNIVMILIRRAYYKSIFLLLQYLLGQAACVTKMFSIYTLYIGSKHIRETDYCAMGVVALKKATPQVQQQLETLSISSYAVVYSTTFKLALSAV